MRETVREFEKRTKARYAPPDLVTKVAQALAPDDALPTLFRFPGPCGLHDHFLGTVRHLAPTPGGELWAAANPINGEAPGAAHFGTVALLQPLRFGFGRAPGDGLFVGVNTPASPDEVVWVPPSKLRAPIAWDSIATHGEARNALGDDARERTQVVDALGAYLEELAAVTKAGFPEPNVRWCDRPAETRARMLADAGLRGPWTQRAPVHP